VCQQCVSSGGGTDALILIFMVRPQRGCDPSRCDRRRCPMAWCGSDFAKVDGVGSAHGFALRHRLVPPAGEEFVEIVAQARARRVDNRPSSGRRNDGRPNGPGGRCSRVSGRAHAAGRCSRSTPARTFHQPCCNFWPRALRIRPLPPNCASACGPPFDSNLLADVEIGIFLFAGVDSGALLGQWGMPANAGPARSRSLLTMRRSQQARRSAMEHIAGSRLSLPDAERAGSS
jgi:hypothetical protein